MDFFGLLVGGDSGLLVDFGLLVLVLYLLALMALVLLLLLLLVVLLFFTCVGDAIARVDVRTPITNTTALIITAADISLLVATITNATRYRCDMVLCE